MKAARTEANLTQECLAELIGVHWQTVSYLESGKHPFPITSFVRLTQALDISGSRLLDGIPEPDKRQFEKIKKALARKRQPKSLTRNVKKA